MLLEYMLIGCVSAAILAYELLLSRILAIQYWSYFAAMIVSLAMLGFAASGTALFLARNRRASCVPAVGAWLLATLPLVVPLCFRLSNLMPCMPLVILWEPRQFGWFALHYLTLAIPFFWGGFIIGQYFLRPDLPVGRVYFANLFGSGLGVVAALLLLTIMSPVRALHAVALPLPVVGFRALASRRPRLVSLAALAIAVVLLQTAPGLPRLSEYKEMSHLLRLPDTAVEREHWSPYGHTCVIGSSHLRYAPGLSLSYHGVIPSQKAILVDGDGLAAVCDARDDRTPIEFLDAMLDALPYRLFPAPRVLILSPGGGMDVLNAVAHGARSTDVVEVEPGIVALMRGPLHAFSGGLYRRADVKVTLQNPRLHCRSMAAQYDLVMVPARGSPFAAATGTSAQDANYLLTRQGFRDALAAVAPGGALVFDAWLNVPPREEMKIFATAVATLRAQGIPAPERHLLWVRAVRACLLMVFRDPIPPALCDRARRFCDQGGFDLVFLPGIRVEDTERFNRIEGHPHVRMALAILFGDPESVYRQHVYNIRPATDDRPYFHHYFKWSALPQVLRKTGANAAVQIGWGYLFLLVTLLQAVPLGALFILAPLRRWAPTFSLARGMRWRAYAYFAAIGGGFMAVEMAALQQVARFVRHPLLAFAIVLTLLLLGSGLGALASRRPFCRPPRFFAPLVVLIVLHACCWRVAVDDGTRAFFPVDLAVLGALSFCMGMPFPQAIDRLRTLCPDLIPWLWGINGYMSVLAVLGAGLLAVSGGLTVLCGAAAALYLAAWLLFPGRGAPSVSRDTIST